MNGSMFWRLVWKEYRLQRALWIAMFVLTALVMGLCCAFVSPQDRPPMLYLFAAGLPAFCLLGSGAMAFAGEREARTYEFQRTLPVGAGWVFAAKLLFILAAATILFGVLGLGAFLLSRGAPRGSLELPGGFGPPGAFVMVIVGFFGVEMLLWATLFSLLVRNVLVAAVLGVAAASLSVQAFIGLHDLAFTDVATWAYWAMPWRMALAALVALVDVWLGACWFRQRSDRRRRGGRAAPGTAAAGQATVLAGRLGSPQRMAIVGRLVWQHWRQSAWLTGALLAVNVCLLGGIVGRWAGDQVSREWVDFRGDPLIFWFGVVPVLLCVPLLGLSAFLPDQWGASYRFLSDRGVAPKNVWLSRQLVAWLPLSVMLPLFLAFAALLAPMRYSPAVQNFVRCTTMTCGCVCCYVVLGVAVGQFCSMLFRSSILAGLFSILLSAGLMVWCVPMLFWGANWLWSVLPIPLALLLATRLRTRDWLLGRNRLRAWLAPALAFLVPAAALLTAVPLYRIHQVPDIAPGFSVETYERPMTPAEKATLDLYRQAVEALRHNLLDVSSHPLLLAGEQRALTPTEIAALDANRKAIALALRASRGTFFYPIDDNPELFEIEHLDDWLLLDTIHLENEDKLDAALDRYMAALRICGQIRACDLHGFPSMNLLEPVIYAHLRRWAARPHQTAARIRAAERLLTAAAAHDSLTAPLKLEYFYLRRILQGDRRVPFGLGSSGARPLDVGILLGLELPWERARALRLLNLQTRLEFLAAERAYGPEEPPFGISWDPESLAAWRWIERNLSGSRLAELFYGLRYELLLAPISYTWNGEDVEPWRWYPTLADRVRVLETMQNATRLVLTLEAWKLEHGRLPQRLEELVGHGLDRLPLDPYSGEAFRYLPAGLAMPVRFVPPVGWTVWAAGGVIPAQTPLIWSTGMNVRKAKFESTEGRGEQYRIRQNGETVWHMPRSDFDVWESGWPCPIP